MKASRPARSRPSGTCEFAGATVIEACINASDAVDAAHLVDSVCDHAIWCARRLGSNIEALYVESPRPPGGMEAELDVAAFARAAQRLLVSAPGSVGFCSAKGDFPRLAARLTARSEVLVLGRNRFGPGASFGASAGRILGEASGPVFLASRRFAAPERALVVVDASRPDAALAAWAGSSPLLTGLEIEVTSITDAAPAPKPVERAAASVTSQGERPRSLVLLGLETVRRTSNRRLRRLAAALVHSDVPLLFC